MSVEELKEATLQVIRQIFEETGSSSSSKSLFRKVDGLNNRNFYKIFESVERAHELAGVPYDKSRKDKMKKVRKKIGTKSEKRVKRETQVDNPSTLTSMDPSANPQLLKDIMKILYGMQGIMGAPTINGAIKQAYQNEVSTAKFKVTHWPTYKSGDEEFTTEAMVESLLGYIDYQESELNDNLKSIREAEAEIERLEEFTEERYEEGLEQGRREHAIYVKCVYCGKPYQVKPLSKTHGVITQALVELGWGHASCVRKDEYDRGAGSRALEAALSRF